MKRLSILALLLLPVILLAQASYNIVTVPFSLFPNFVTGNGSTLFNFTLTGNVISSSLNGGSLGMEIIFNICQDGVGNHSFLWPPNVSGPPPVLQSANACTIAKFINNGGFNWVPSGTNSLNSAAATTGTFTSLTVSGAGTLTNINTTIYVGNSTYACTAAGVNAALVAARGTGIAGTGAGIVDATACSGNVTMNAQINVGDSVFDPVTLKLPSSGGWDFNMTDGVSCGIKQFSQTQIVSQGGANPPFQLLALTGASLKAVYCTDPSPSTGSSYIRAEGFSVKEQTGVTLSTTGINTTAAAVAANVATLTFGSNPLTFGFTPNLSVTVSGFTGADTYFNGSFIISTVTATTITFPLTHANASATSNGTAFMAAVMDVRQIFDSSRFRDISLRVATQGHIALLATGTCCASEFNNTDIDAGNLGVPLKLNGNVNSTTFLGVSPSHPGSGLNAISITGSAFDSAFYTVYIEDNTNGVDTTTPLIEGSGTAGGSVAFYGGLANILSGSTNKYVFKRDTGANPVVFQIHGLGMLGGSGSDQNCINDAQTGLTYIMSNTSTGTCPNYGAGTAWAGMVLGRGGLPVGDVTFDYASATEQPTAWRNNTASGKTWFVGDGVTAPGTFTVFDNTDSKNLANFVGGATGGTLNLPTACTTTTIQIAGAPTVVCAITSQKTESAADANVLTFTPPAQAGTYRLSLVGSISAASAATLGWTATWADSNGNAASPTNLSVCLASTGVCGATTGALSAVDRFSGVTTIDVSNAATNIVIKLTFSGTSFTAKVSATVERII